MYVIVYLYSYSVEYNIIRYIDHASKTTYLIIQFLQ